MAHSSKDAQGLHMGEIGGLRFPTVPPKIVILYFFSYPENPRLAHTTLYIELKVLHAWTNLLILDISVTSLDEENIRLTDLKDYFSKIFRVRVFLSR